jgi:hypothetical protein
MQKTEMQGLLGEYSESERNRANLEKELAEDVRSTQKDIQRAVKALQGRSQTVEREMNLTTNLIRRIEGLLLSEGSTDVSLLRQGIKGALREYEEIVRGLDSGVYREKEDSPPPSFSRVPKPEVAVVNSDLLQTDDLSPPSGLESFLDNMFSSNDSIYESTIKNLRNELIQVVNQNNALEVNLVLAEKEIDYWRKKDLKGRSDTCVRKVDAKVWKHAVSKFIGSFDQFSQLRVLYYWRDAVRSSKPPSTLPTSS